MKAKFLPSIKKAVLTDVASEIEDIKGYEIIGHGLGTNNKNYYLLLIVEEELEIIQYDITGVPEEAVEEFSSK